MSSFEDLRDFLARNPIKMPDSTPEPQGGQVWRASWSDVSLDVYLAEANEDTVLAAPVSPHSDATRTPATYFIDGEESPLGYAVAVWASLRMELPLFVLDGCYGAAPIQLEEPEVPTQSELIEAARAADTQAVLRARIHQKLEELAAATWKPKEAAIGPIRRLVKQRHSTLRDVSDRISLPEAMLRQVSRTGWWLTPAQVSELAFALDVPTLDLPRSDPFTDTPNLVRTINSPRRRPSLRRLSDRLRISEIEIRLETAGQLLAAAGREAAGGDPDSRERWEQLMDLYLADA